MSAAAAAPPCCEGGAARAWASTLPGGAASAWASTLRLEASKLQPVLAGARAVASRRGAAWQPGAAHRASTAGGPSPRAAREAPGSLVCTAGEARAWQLGPALRASTAGGPSPRAALEAPGGLPAKGVAGEARAQQQGTALRASTAGALSPLGAPGGLLSARGAAAEARDGFGIAQDLPRSPATPRGGVFLSALLGTAGEARAGPGVARGLPRGPATPRGGSPAAAREVLESSLPRSDWSDVIACLLDGSAATTSGAAASVGELSRRLAAGRGDAELQAELQAEVRQLVARVRQLGSQLGETSLERDAAAAQAQRLQREADARGAESRAASRRLAAAQRRLRGGAAAGGACDPQAQASPAEEPEEEPEAAETRALRAQIEALRREREGMRAEIAARRTELLQGQPRLEELRRRLCRRLGELEGLRQGLGALPAEGRQGAPVQLQGCFEKQRSAHEDARVYLAYDA